jgi:hypothetical protein
MARALTLRAYGAWEESLQKMKTERMHKSEKIDSSQLSRKPIVEKSLVQNLIAKDQPEPFEN